MPHINNISIKITYGNESCITKNEITYVHSYDKFVKLIIYKNKYDLISP